MADYLADGGRRVQAWQARHAHAEAAFASPQDFLNVNDAADLARAESVAAAATTVDKA
jgi:molybdopterin-guanine dinucleotide biosynthesis protein A